jgi:hypothetical protein
MSSFENGHSGPGLSTHLVESGTLVTQDSLENISDVDVCLSDQILFHFLCRKCGTRSNLWISHGGHS